MEQSQPVTSTASFENRASAPQLPLQASGLAGASLAEIAHEARHMVVALGLYCDLLEEPGVFDEPYQYYGDELKMVAGASRSLVNRRLTLSDGSAGNTGEAAGTIPRLDSGAADAVLAWPEALMPESKAAHYCGRCGRPAPAVAARPFNEGGADFWG